MSPKRKLPSTSRHRRGCTRARRRNRSRAQTRRLLEHDRDVGVEFPRHLLISRRAAARTGGARHILGCLVEPLTSSARSVFFGLDNAITTFIARSRSVGNRARSRTLFRIAVVLGVAQSIITAAIVIVALRFFNNRLHVPPQMVSALALVLCAMPGWLCTAISTAVSRGMKVMQHDIYSRGMTEPIVTTLAFLLAFAVGFKESSPEVAAIVGTAASGIVALALASTLFRHVPARRTLYLLSPKHAHWSHMLLPSAFIS